VALWVLFNDSSGEQVLTEKWIQGFTKSSEGWLFTKIEDNSVRFSVSSAGQEELMVDSALLEIPAASWIHFAATRNAGKIVILMNSTPVAEGFSLLNLNSTSSLKFGHRGNPIDTPGSEDDSGFYLNGRIDEVQLFVGTALSDDQIKAIYESGSAGLCKSPPKIYLPLIFKGINRVCPGGPGSPPTLDWVTLTPNLVPANSTPQVLVYFSFLDANGDLDNGTFNYVSPAGQTVSFPLPNELAGITSYTVGAMVIITTDSQKGTFKIPTWLKDKNGNCSNIVYVDWTQY
jgi:hypothetical protein